MDKASQEIERLQKIIDRYKFLYSVGPAVIYVSKAYGDFGATFIGENVKNQMGYKPDDFIKDSKFWADHIHPDDRERILKDMDNLFKKGEYAHEYRFKHADGSYRWMLDEMKLIKDNNGKPKEIIGYWVDITSRKEIEKQLKEKVEELEKVNKLMTGRELEMMELKEKIKKQEE